MPSSRTRLPTPLSAYVGLIATAVDGTREAVRTAPLRAAQLPLRLAADVVSLRAHVLRRYTELADRGDEVVAHLRGEELPTEDAADDLVAATTTAEERWAAAGPADSVDGVSGWDGVAGVDTSGAAADEVAAETEALAEAEVAEEIEAAESAEALDASEAADELEAVDELEAAEELAEAAIELAAAAADEAEDEAEDADEAAQEEAEQEAEDDAVDRAEELAAEAEVTGLRLAEEPVELADGPVDLAAEPVRLPTQPTGADEPLTPTSLPEPATPATTAPEHDELPLPDFDHMTLGSLRGRLRRLDVGSLEQLLAYEQTHAQRLPILTMLENRIEKLRADGEG